MIERAKGLPERAPELTYIPADPTNCLRESRGVQRLAAARELDSHGRSERGAGNSNSNSAGRLNFDIGRPARRVFTLLIIK